MFSLFKRNPVKKLNKLYLIKLEQAMHAQRNGDIRSYAMITADAEEIKDKITALEQAQKEQTEKSNHVCK